MRLLFFCAALVASTVAQAQMTFSGRINPVELQSDLVVNVPYDCWYDAANSTRIKPDAQGRFSLVLPVNKPQVFFLDYRGQRLFLYAEPDASLSVSIQSSGVDSLRFGGTLGGENQLRHQLGLSLNLLGPQSWNDTLTPPVEILDIIRQNQVTAAEQLSGKAGSMSPAFRRITKADIQFFASSKMWDLAWKNGVWTTENKSGFSKDAWRVALVKAHQNLNLSDTLALDSYHYQTTMAYYPRFLEYRSATKEEFMRLAEEIFHKPFAEVKNEVKQKGQRYWEYAALNYGLEGIAREHALAAFLRRGVVTGDLEYLREAYEDFIRRFPTSRYRPEVETTMEPYLTSLAQNEQPGIHLVPGSQEIPSLDSVLAAHRGRVVYVDMWGSWCGPCRTEFAYTQELKDRFKDLPVDFVYIAVEHSPAAEKRWRDTIAFYDLTGDHVLAGKELEKSLRDMYTQTGNFQFPSYILVDKAGKIVTIQAPRPSDQEKLYEQIEQLL
ncbi:redoxin family protein [Salmonirosea aquatica]|uniref:Redoxin family protein n=1 Tax=Salmonirosea aquatica TaxID=2654236 RepID=A0A7C9BGN7_9BACT|nr:redoxin family protein [Cytophagaceae bacterium SJW1-29]